MVEDRTLEFVLRRDASLPRPSLSVSPSRTHWRAAWDDFQSTERFAVWAAKSSLDHLDPAVYTAARDAAFPLAACGSQGVRAFGNRAGHKLREAMDASGVWERLRAGRAVRVAFADLCGGPGAFTQALLALAPRKGLRLRGFGMTLRGAAGLDWYAHLPSARFVPTYGVDGTGDIFRLENIDALHSLVAAEHLMLVVADGGFHVAPDVANYQETISGRILFGQWLAALRLLRIGGCFVLKLFDTFSPLLRAMLFLSTHLYENVHIVKPRHSRVVNSERYLVCLGYNGTPKEWMTHFEHCYTEGFTDNDNIPTIMSTEWMMQDKTFTSDLAEMNATIAANQIEAIGIVLDRINSSKENE